MKHKTYLFFFTLFSPSLINTNGIDAIDFTQHSPINHKLSGYIKSESYVDSRQVMGTSTDQSLLLPEMKELGAAGKDKNGNGQTQLVAIETRIRYDFTGPDICNAHTHATVEGDFYGTQVAINRTLSGSANNLFRLREAVLFLDFEKVSLTFGQTWHPTFIPECYADTVSFNNGAPFDIYARWPQFRFTYHYNTIDIIACAASQIITSTDSGPQGFTDEYARNAIMPDFHGQVRYAYNDHYAGIGYDIKRLRPRLFGNPVGEEQKVFVTSESLISQMALVYYAHHGGTMRFCTKAFYAQNSVDLGTIGGYAVHTVNPQNDKRTYTNIHVLGGMIDFTLVAYEDCIQPGIMFGYVHNLGAQKTIDMSVDPYIFGIGANASQAFRISPRCRWIYNNITFAAELEYTRAAYGTFTNKNNRSKIMNSSWVGNMRALFATYYFF